MKIAVQLPVIYEEDNVGVRAIVDATLWCMRQVSNAGTELIARPAYTIDDMRLESGRFECGYQVLRSMEAAAHQGFDGIVDCCFFDPGLWTARSKIGVPVAGLGESSMQLAALMGRKFAIITSQSEYAQAMEDNVVRYGFASQALPQRPVRSVDIGEFDAVGMYLSGKASDIAEAFAEIARPCIAEGADVIIVGCGVLSSLMEHGAGLQHIDGVPVINPAVASIKAVETLVSLKAAGLPFKSDTGYLRAGL